MVAVFVYMATELAPSHTHSRVRNLQHCFMFALGLLVSSMAELLEGFAEENDGTA